MYPWTGSPSTGRDMAISGLQFAINWLISQLVLWNDVPYRSDQQVVTSIDL